MYSSFLPDTPIIWRYIICHFYLIEKEVHLVEIIFVTVINVNAQL